MLRRYNSKHLDTILLKNKRTTIGSAASCDVVIKGRGVAAIHASIESNSAGYFLKEHSLSGMTRVNDRPVFGQIEIHGGDLIQVGGAPAFVFDSEWMFGTRPNSAALMGKTRSPIHAIEEDSHQQQTLPMISGKKIHPLTQSQQGSFSDSAIRKRSNSAKHTRLSSASSTESRSPAFYSNPRSMIGNNLIQRVLKLQAEIVEKDEKIRQLTFGSMQSSLPYYHHPSLPAPISMPQQAPPIFQQAPPPPPPLPLPQFYRQKSPKSFELFAYRAFIGAITSQLRQFNDRVLRHPQRDSAELFNLMCRAVDVPLSSRIVEIEKFCEAVLIDNDFEDTDELMQKLADFIRESRREKILELTNELECLMPLIRDAAANARENIKVVNVFTQWSRQFGDLLRKNHFSATTLFQAIEDLKIAFSEAHMSRHWLPPSITPILRLAALELEKRDGEFTPSASPPPALLDRKQSTDMTLDTCVSQVETITHEMDYHVVRLHKKAKEYSTFQPLDLDTVIRVSKIVDSLKANEQLLTELSFKEDRPTSVLFFEVTNDDLKNSFKNSNGDGGSTSSMGSTGSVHRKISAPMKVPESFLETDEILEEQKEVESDMRSIIGRIGDRIGSRLEESSMNERLISVNESALKLLLQESERLLASYESLLSEEAVRKKRSIPPIIFVENEPEIHEISTEEAEKVENSDSEVTTSEEPSSEETEAPICAKPAQSVENSEISVTDNAETAENPENLTSCQSGDVTPRDDDSESEVLENSQILTSEDAPEASEAAEIESPNIPTNSDAQQASQEPEESENEIPPVDSLAPTSPEPTESPMTSPELPPVTSNAPEDHSEDIEPINDDSDSGDDQTTVLYIPPKYIENLDEPSKTSDLSQDLDDADIAPEEVTNAVKSRPNGDVIRETPLSGEQISSHLKSHINTANGKPHITYQYPINRYHSPPMKRRSRSVDQKPQQSLRNRPRFVLY